MTLWTIGHSILPLDEFLAMLRGHDVQTVADVRRFPGSRRHPQFSQKTLADSLNESGLSYEHFPELGGRRQPQKDSVNTAWRNAAFRGYADYMMTSEFHTGVVRLLALAGRSRTAIMCAEAVWWRCHRGLIADFLKADGHEVLHIQSATKAETHPFTTAARIVDGALSYGPDRDLLG